METVQALFSTVAKVPTRVWPVVEVFSDPFGGADVPIGASVYAP
jgi:hypothetical protein